MTLSSSPRVGLLAPMPMELRAVVKAFSLRRSSRSPDAWVGAVGGADIVATTTGIGMTRAARATDRIVNELGAEHVIVVGIAGGIAPDVELAQVVKPDVVIDVASGSEHTPAPLAGEAGGRLCTSDDFITDLDVIGKLIAGGVTAIDMETSAVAAASERLGTPWSVVRSISDRAGDEEVGDHVIGLIRPDGRANLPAVARHLARRPARVRVLARLARDAGRAGRAAAEAAAAACRDQWA